MTILIFFGVLFLLVLVHEWGHFIVAKKTGMRVDEFGIGFPPKLFGIKWRGTEYTFNLLPIGGFVKIWGEDGTDVPSSPVTNEVSDHRSETNVEAGEGGNNSFASKSKWAQAAVLVAGVTMNILFAWLLFAIALSIGTPTAVSEEVASDNASLVITQVLQGGPAAEAQIPRGATIVSLETSSGILENMIPSAFTLFTSERVGQRLVVSYEIENRLETKEIVAVQGLIPDDPDRYAIGIALSLVERISSPVHVAVYESLILTLTSLRDITVGITGLLVDAATLNADFSQVAGPVGIVGLVGEAASFGFTSLLMFTAFISLNLAVINMLPFPALDGGRLLFVAIETVKGSPIKSSWVHGLNMIGFVLLILLMVAVTYNDVLRII